MFMIYNHAFALMKGISVLLVVFTLTKGFDNSHSQIDKSVLKNKNFITHSQDNRSEESIYNTVSVTTETTVKSTHNTDGCKFTCILS